MKRIYVILIFLIVSQISHSQTPVANAGVDTLFCGFEGTLNAIPSSGTGVWSSNYVVVNITEPNNPQSPIFSDVINSGNPFTPFFEVVWTETNAEDSDSDTIKIIFARIPSSEIDIIPPKCFGELATITAIEDSLPQYLWDFHNGISLDTVQANIEGGFYKQFANWESLDTSHVVSLISTNIYGCQSTINIDTVYEPSVPSFEVTIIPDTCTQGNGGIIFTDTLGNNSFFWLDEDFGYYPGTPFYTISNIPNGTYDIGTSYLSFNTMNYAYYLTTFGTSNCVDTMAVTVDSHNLFDITCPEDLELNYYTTYMLNLTPYVSPIGGTYYLDGEEISEINTYNYENGIYEMTYSYYDSATDCQGSCSFNLIIDINSGIEEIINEHFSIFPNPTTGIFKISDDNKLIKEVSIFDINGTEVYHNSNFSEESINIGNLSKGLYFLKILSDEGIAFKKLVLE